MRTLTASILLLFGVVLLPDAGHAQYLESRTLSLDGARQVLEGSLTEARANGWDVAISIVDPAGGQILFQRFDGVGPLPLEIALRKARTAARFGQPTKALADMVAGGGIGFLALEGLMPLEGGLPILVDGQIVGAIGVSGVRGDQDAQIAQAGIDALLQ
ncbi:MAG: heme-binding protein [Gemmatimonadota bacterium]